ncbi:MAG TPA: PfkB family carbohydrate kinase [Alloacidobacterium sp.]|jgi:sugar/nucleoside kinase (ribokinase family)|nr:PfkB family carbohydrate kinase [Alloacidobacterium sp.]
MSSLTLQADPENGFVQVVGVGGIGTGIILALEGDHTLGRNESRLGEMLDARDYCKLHIVEHYIAVLMGATNGLFRVFAIGNVGGDPAGDALLQEMADVGIDTSYVCVEPDRSTLYSICFQYPDRSGGNITTSNSAARELNSDQLSACRNTLAAAGGSGVALCLPEVPMEARQEFLQIATECGSYRVASFLAGEMELIRKLGLLSQVDLLALNHEEAAALAGLYFPATDRSWLLDGCSQAGRAANPAMKMIVSAGADGVYVFEEDTWSHHAAAPMDAISTAGAGDALLAGVIAGLSAGMPLTNIRSTSNRSNCNAGAAIDLGLVLACFSLTSPHTIHPEVEMESLLSFAKEKGLPVSIDLHKKNKGNLTVSVSAPLRGK